MRLKYERLRRFAGVFAIVLAAGCQSIGENYSEARNSWDSASYDSVIAQWGQPSRHTTLADGRQVYTWFSQQGGGGGVYPSIGLSSGNASSLGVGTGVALSQGSTESTRCERTLYFKDERVVDQSWLGPWRYCSSFARR